MKIKIPKFSDMNEMDRVAWRGFITGVIIAVLSLAPFVLLALAMVVTGWNTHHVHVPMP